MDMKKTGEDAQRLLRQRYDLILNAAGEGILGVDPDGKISFVNRATLSLGRYPEAEMLGRPLGEFLVGLSGSADCPDKVPVMRGGVSTGASGVRVDGEFRRGDGSAFPVQYIVTPIQDGHRLVGGVVVFADITQRKGAEACLKASEASYRALFEAAHEAIFVSDANGILVSANPRAIALLGYEAADEFLGRPAQSIYAAPSQRQVIFESLRRQGYAENVEIVLKRSDGGSVTVQGSFAAHKDAGGRIQRVEGIFTDVTQRKRAEAAACRVNKAVKILSECNQALARVTKEAELLSKVCKILVEVGGYRLAWIGFAEQDSARTIRQAAEAGDRAGSLGAARAIWGEGALGMGPAGQAVRLAVPAVVRDIPNDPHFGPWRTEACRRGYTSCAGFPLRNARGAMGVLMVYASDPEAFDADETRLLAELACDVAYGVNVLRIQTERKREEKIRRRLQERLEMLWGVASLVDADHRTLCDHVLLGIRTMTRSQYGFLGFLDESESRMTIYAWSQEVMEVCRVEHRPVEFALDEAGVFAKAIRERRPLLINDYGAEAPSAPRLPNGHVPLRRLLCVPIGTGERATALVAVANKKDPYDAEDAEQIRAFVTSILAVLEKRKAHDALRRSKTRYRHLIEAVTDYIYTVALDADGGTVTTVHHPGCVAVTGYSPQEYDANPLLWHQMIYEDDRAEVEAQIQRLLAGESVSPFEHRIRHKDGSIQWVRNTPVPRHDEHGKLTGYDSLVRNVTEQREAEEAVKVAFDQLEIRVCERTAELEAVNARLRQEVEERRQTQNDLAVAKEAAEAASRAKSTFLAGMSHELRTPLNAIIGFSEILLEKFFGDLAPKQEEYVQDILASGRHLLALVNDILDLSKVEAGKMTVESSRFRLGAVLQSALMLIKEKALRHGIAVELSLSAEISALEITADERKLKQILYNLLSNAVKFTPDGGWVRVEANRADEGLVVSVTDSGIGIAPDDQKKVFEEFYQVHGGIRGKSPGTGLGLSLVCRLVGMHGGKVWMHSDGLGKGSRFSFSLPVDGPEPPGSVHRVPGLAETRV